MFSGAPGIDKRRSQRTGLAAVVLAVPERYLRGGRCWLRSLRNSLTVLTVWAAVLSPVISAEHFQLQQAWLWHARAVLSGSMPNACLWFYNMPIEK